MSLSCVNAARKTFMCTLARTVFHISAEIPRHTNCTLGVCCRQQERLLRLHCAREARARQANSAANRNLASRQTSFIRYICFSQKSVPTSVHHILLIQAQQKQETMADEPKTPLKRSHSADTVLLMTHISSRAEPISSKPHNTTHDHLNLEVSSLHHDIDFLSRDSPPPKLLAISDPSTRLDSSSVHARQEEKDTDYQEPIHLNIKDNANKQSLPNSGLIHHNTHLSRSLNNTEAREDLQTSCTSAITMRDSEKTKSEEALEAELNVNDNETSCISPDISVHSSSTDSALNSCPSSADISQRSSLANAEEFNKSLADDSAESTEASDDDNNWISAMPFASEELSSQESDDEGVYKLNKLFAGRLFEEDKIKSKKKSKTKGDKGTKARANYFVGIKISNPEIHAKIKRVQEFILEKQPALKKALIPVETSHITLVVLRISDEEELKRACTTIQECHQELCSVIKSPITLEFEGLSHFQNQVLFCQPQPADAIKRLEKIAEITTRLLQQNNVTVHESKAFNPHLTILKLSRAPALKSKGIKKIDPAWYVYYKNEEFGTENVKGIQLLSMLLPKDENGYYQCIDECSFDEMYKSYIVGGRVKQSSPEKLLATSEVKDDIKKRFHTLTVTALEKIVCREEEDKQNTEQELKPNEVKIELKAPESDMPANG